MACLSLRGVLRATTALSDLLCARLVDCLVPRKQDHRTLSQERPVQNSGLPKLSTAQEVVRCAAQKIRRVFELSDPKVAVHAQQSAHIPAVVAMIHHRKEVPDAHILMSAYRTFPRLLLHQIREFRVRHAVFLEALRLSRVRIRLLPFLHARSQRVAEFLILRILRPALCVVLGLLFRRPFPELLRIALVVLLHVCLAGLLVLGRLRIALRSILLIVRRLLLSRFRVFLLPCHDSYS